MPSWRLEDWAGKAGFNIFRPEIMASIFPHLPTDMPPMSCEEKNGLAFARKHALTSALQHQLSSYCTQLTASPSQSRANTFFDEAKRSSAAVVGRSPPAMWFPLSCFVDFKICKVLQSQVNFDVPQNYALVDIVKVRKSEQKLCFRHVCTQCTPSQGIVDFEKISAQ